ncbi:MAG: flavodoxin [Lachnospiraceae bacterium]|nr:flavodoxin [Lachnospiraceae bacterium]
MENKKNLVVFYSWGENTKAVAEYIAKKTDADIVELKVKDEYPMDYQECIRRVRSEGRTYEAELRNEMPDLTNYQTIFVGSPCWWGTIASAMRTFLKENEFKGKTVAPFMTHGTSGLCIQELKSLCSGADITEGLSIFNEYQVSTTKNDVKNMGNYEVQTDKWLKRIGC